MREDPWEFEHSQTRINRHEREWVDFVREENDPDFKPPTKVEVCPQCGGRGTSSLYLGSFSHDQMTEDPDFAEDYMRGGYDRTCDSCQGRNVVETIDVDRLTHDQLQSFNDWMGDAYESDSIQRMEWRAGA